MPTIVEKSDAVSMPCRTRRLNGVCDANSSSTCSGFTSPVMAMKRSTSASVNVFVKLAC